MINKEYWKEIAKEWKKGDDSLPKIPLIDIIEHLNLEEDELIDDELIDILADLNLD